MQYPPPGVITAAETFLRDDGEANTTNLFLEDSEMKKLAIILAVMGLVWAGTGIASASYHFGDDFETAWTGDYASGWANIEYAHGAASIPKMTQYTTVTANGHTITPLSGLYFMGLQVTAAGDPATNWWGGVKPEFVSASALDRQYSPWVSVSFYDYGVGLPAPQLSAVPNSSDPDDWTDIQMGQRWDRTDNYWYAESMNFPSQWVKTTVARSVGWHELKFAQDTAGYITYSIDGTPVGTTTTAYLDLAYPWLQIQFDYDDFGAEVYFDNFQGGSTIPEPATILVWGLLGLVAAGYGVWRRRRAA